MKFKFGCDDCGTVNTHEFETDTWFEVLPVFTLFLRGCGFLIPESASVEMMIEEDGELVAYDPFQRATDEIAEEREGFDES